MSGLRKAVAVGVAVFIGSWLFAIVACAIIDLHWSTPADWRPASRAFVLFEGLLVSVWAAVMVMLNGRRP